jgi:hypothetical protein
MDKVLLGLISGIAFGFVIQRVGATNSDKMARAHLMIEPQIPQFMLLAVIFGAVGVFGLKLAGIGRFLPLPTSIVATGLAAIIFGIGWGMTGYCPGTCWAAAGEGRGDAISALIGGFAGTAVFAHFHELLVPLLYSPTNIGQITLDGLFNSTGAALIVLVVFFAGGVFMIGRLWQKNES